MKITSHRLKVNCIFVYVARKYDIDASIERIQSSMCKLHEILQSIIMMMMTSYMIHDDDACMYVSRLPVSISTPLYVSPSSLLCYLVDTKSEWHLACYIHLVIDKRLLVVYIKKIRNQCVN